MSLRWSRGELLGDLKFVRSGGARQISMHYNNQNESAKEKHLSLTKFFAVVVLL
jgi:hypothetical protein